MGHFRWWKTAKEKEQILKDYLREFLTDHDKLTGKVEIPACLRAEDEVRIWKKKGLIDYYYALYVLDRKNIRERQRIAKKYGVLKPWNVRVAA